MMMVTREWLQSWPRFLVVGRVEYHIQRLHHSPLLCPKPSLRNSQQPENANISTTLLRFLYAGDSQALVKQSNTYSSTYFILKAFYKVLPRKLQCPPDNTSFRGRVPSQLSDLLNCKAFRRLFVNTL